MTKANTIKELYKLEYQADGLQYGLVEWYNKLLDKTIDELDYFDVGKMVRQKVLKEVAIDKAIDFFLEQPYEGEMWDGDLLEMFLACKSELLNNVKKEVLITRIPDIEKGIENYGWSLEEEKIDFRNNLLLLKQLLEGATQ